jgi:hypothetical protein
LAKQVPGLLRERCLLEGPLEVINLADLERIG